MLSPNDLLGKRMGKAESLWSCDSGYGSHAEDVPSTQHQSNAIGLGLSLDLDSSAYWNIHIEDQLRVSDTLARSPIEPVTTRLNVFTASIDGNSTNDFFLPRTNASGTSCGNCQLLNFTNLGEGVKCDDCCEKECAEPTFTQQQLAPVIPIPPVGPNRIRNVIPRLEIPREQPKDIPRYDSSVHCSSCRNSLLSNPNGHTNCSSCAPDPARLSPISPNQSTQIRRSCARPAKLPQYALQRLNGWLRENSSNPYPNADTKRTLAQECGITEKQVNTWFTNARARGKINADRSNSHSEDDHLYDSAFSSVTTTPICGPGSGFDQTGGTISSRRASDTPSLVANAFQQGTPVTSRRGKKKDYGAMLTHSPIESNHASPFPHNAVTSSPNSDHETWHCTFCYVPVAPKSWRRHEETQHRPKRQWTCLLHGARLVVPAHSLPPNSITEKSNMTSTLGQGLVSVCAFCMALDPTDQHFAQEHRITDCEQKDPSERTFLRPDHLRQHVRNFHKCKLEDVVRDSWRVEGAAAANASNEINAENERWPCGFCDMELNGWNQRETHIAAHFKDSANIRDWDTEKVQKLTSKLVRRAGVKRRSEMDDQDAGREKRRFGDVRDRSAISMASLGQQAPMMQANSRSQPQRQVPQPMQHQQHSVAQSPAATSYSSPAPTFAFPASTPMSASPSLHAPNPFLFSQQIPDSNFGMQPGASLPPPAPFLSDLISDTLISEMAAFCGGNQIDVDGTVPNFPTTTSSSATRSEELLAGMQFSESMGVMGAMGTQNLFPQVANDNQPMQMNMQGAQVHKQEQEQDEQVPTTSGASQLDQWAWQWE